MRKQDSEKHSRDRAPPSPYYRKRKKNRSSMKWTPKLSRAATATARARERVFNHHSPFQQATIDQSRVQFFDDEMRTTTSEEDEEWWRKNETQKHTSTFCSFLYSFLSSSFYCCCCCCCCWVLCFNLLLASCLGIFSPFSIATHTYLPTYPPAHTHLLFLYTLPPSFPPSLSPSLKATPPTRKNSAA